MLQSASELQSMLDCAAESAEYNSDQGNVLPYCWTTEPFDTSWRALVSDWYQSSTSPEVGGPLLISRLQVECGSLGRTEAAWQEVHEAKRIVGRLLTDWIPYAGSWGLNRNISWEWGIGLFEHNSRGTAALEEQYLITVQPGKRKLSLSESWVGNWWQQCCKSKDWGCDHQGSGKSEKLTLLRAQLHQKQLDSLKSAMDQGKSFHSVLQHTSSSRWIGNGWYIMSFVEYRSAIKARLNLLPMCIVLKRTNKLRGSIYCWHCRSQPDTLAHVLNHCRSYMGLIRSWHGDILRRLQRVVQEEFSEVFVEQEIQRRTVLTLWSSIRVPTGSLW